MRRYLAILLTMFSFMTPLAWAKKKAATVKSPAGAEVTVTLNAYRVAGSLKAKVKKTVVQESLGTESKSEGDFYFSKGKMRMEIREPEHSLLVFDGKTVWFETPIDERQVHVTKMRAKALTKSDSLLMALFGREDLLKTFKLKASKEKDGRKVYTFEPKDMKKSEVKMLEIALEKKEIQRVTYLDQLENRVSLEFTDMKKGSVPKEKFAYKVPKGAELVEM